MFSEIRKYIGARNSFAIDCKTLTLKKPLFSNFPIPERKLYFSELTAKVLIFIEYLKILKSSGVFGRTKDDCWTNGFFVTSPRFCFTIENAFFSKRASHLLDAHFRVEYGCLVFSVDYPRTPIILVYADGCSMCVGVKEFDTAISRLVKLERDLYSIELYFDKNKSGLVFSVYGVPSIYLARLKLPGFFEPLIIAQSEKYYAYCGN